ncbi:hypothetical protein CAUPRSCDRAFT_12300 [Caulochytrium protostelioides]|uniref:C2H2-type domain-containing protein n=1 Tax=Caulochytrium protostelioides TaxID=1555241 RepID=A0A4P9WV57_9FUNG|nr:hypothetical protein CAUPRSCDRAFT_12300 [Caulochytrium protostelioides]
MLFAMLHEWQLAAVAAAAATSSAPAARAHGSMRPTTGTLPGTISMQSFAAAGAGMSGSLTEDTASMVSGGYLRCKPCRKNFNTENALMNHEASKKHRECVVAWDRANGAPDPNGAAAASASPVSPDAAKATDEAESPSQPRVQVESGPRRDWAKELALAESEEELYRLYDEKIAASVKLDPVHDCLFCVHASEDISANIEHMVKVHSFFIPYLDHVVDVEGLLSYLGKKMAGATTCLQCNGAGRALHTLEAVRKHMIDKGHCSINMADEGLDEFYAFRADELNMGSDDEDDASWEDVGDGAVGGDDNDDAEDEETDADTKKSSSALIFRRPDFAPMVGTNPDEEEGHVTAMPHPELTLPSGKRLGHRFFNRYWRQTLPNDLVPLSEQQQLVRAGLGDVSEGIHGRALLKSTKLQSMYKSMQLTAATPQQQALAVAMCQRQLREEERQEKHQRRRMERMTTKTGIKNNNQAHYRDQIGFST